MTLTEFAHAVAGWSARYPTMSVTSWFRSPARDLAVGGGGASAHTRGPGAVDVVYTDEPGRGLGQAPDQVEATAFAARLGLRLKRRVDHDHLEPADA